MSKGDLITEQKLLEVLNQLSSAGSAVQIYLTRTLTDVELYRQFTTDRENDSFHVNMKTSCVFSFNGSTVSS